MQIKTKGIAVWNHWLLNLHTKFLQGEKPNVIDVFHKAIRNCIFCLNDFFKVFCIDQLAFQDILKLQNDIALLTITRPYWVHLMQVYVNWINYQFPLTTNRTRIFKPSLHKIWDAESILKRRRGINLRPWIL